MAPETKLARKSSLKKSPAQSKSKPFPHLEPDTDADLQVATSASGPQWEGFDRDGEQKSEDESQAESENGSVDVAMDNEDEVTGPDEEEEELERLVFGDSAGFKEGLKSFSLDPSRIAYGSDSEGEEEEEEEEEGEDLDNIADDQLFFFDSGPGITPAGAVVPAKQEDEKEGDTLAWEDSDDERMVVSLATVPRLRKLRETEDDDVVNGKEYVRRLRKQFQRLYPTPEWALQAQGRADKKRRRTTDASDSGDEEASDMDLDDEKLKAEPLARLLQDADILSKTSRNPAKRRKLQAGVVDIQRLKDVAKKGPSAITSLSFHPSYPLLLSSGPSSTVYLHHINPNSQSPNPLLTSLHITHTPLTTTAFHPSATDSRIFLSARRRYFHIWNLASGTVEKVSRVYGHQHEQRTMENFSLSPDGKHMALRGSSKKGGGVINILDANTLQWVTQARIESRGGVADFCWWGDGSGLCIAGKNGEVTEWSIEDGVIGRWNDEGAVGTTIIAVGGRSGRDAWAGGDRWVAVGSSSGVVNLYDRRAWAESTASNASSTTIPESSSNGGLPKNPKPYRVLDHLTTPTSHLAFSPDGQILCMASRWKHNAMRLVHLPSASVFKNWPTDKTPLGRISSVAWGRPSEEDEREGSLAVLAVGMETGRIRLWEVRA